MSLCKVDWFSKTIAKRVSMNVFLPDAGKPPFPVLYLLHGLTDDYTAWQRWTRLECYLRNLPMIVVMPDGFRSFYTNNHGGGAYGTYIGNELPRFVEANFQARQDRGGRGVGGLSMGGYGALRLALLHPERYVSAHSHSGALLLSTCKELSPVLNRREHRQIFGDSPAGGEHDILWLAEQALAAGGPLPRLRLDCGTEDHCLEMNRQVHSRLDSLGLAHEYVEGPGCHNWDYWDLQIRAALDFHCRAMGIGPEA